MSDIPLNGLIQRVLDLQLEFSSLKTPAMEERGILIRNKIPKRVRQAINVFDVEGKDGMGRKARVPLVRIFDVEKSPSARTGYYLVYLFGADGGSVHLSLNQGTTVLTGKQLEPISPQVVAERRATARKHLSDELEDLVTQIDLADKRGLGGGYENGHIAGWSYQRNSIPDEVALMNDLVRGCYLLQKLYETTT